MMEEKNLKRFSLFRKLGAFSINRWSNQRSFRLERASPVRRSIERCSSAHQYQCQPCSAAPLQLWVFRASPQVSRRLLWT